MLCKAVLYRHNQNQSTHECNLDHYQLDVSYGCLIFKGRNQGGTKLSTTDKYRVAEN